MPSVIVRTLQARSVLRPRAITVTFVLAIDARDLQCLSFAMWLLSMPCFSETATESPQIMGYLKPLKLHFTKYLAEIVMRMVS